MPTCALPPISQLPHSTCQPLHTPLADPALPCLPFLNSPHTIRATSPPQKHCTMATTTFFAPFSTLTHTQLLFTVLATLLLLTNPIPSSSSLLELRRPGISTAPAFLPIEPAISSIPPTLAPDMMPLFPSPGGNAKAAPAGILPIIPSNPNTPNPDKLQPNSAITPSSSAAVTSVASSLGNFVKESMVVLCGLALVWWLELMDE